ncbi:anti-sigma factor antagonist [Streptomyces bobili]|uniref:anti-sigma factor antagonist n=1 Tax=Streptomyces bobili TaxID=67280 RepID=UPI001FC91A6B|nr:anti-sigma factor antagonist [Streptomyces bobili]
MQQEPATDTPHLRVREDRGYTVLEFRGEIDIVAATEIGSHLDSATAGPAPRVVLDLSGIEFFDCSGLRLLYRARGRVLDHGGDLHLVCTHALTLRILRATGLSRLLPPAASLDDALDRPGATSGSL